MKKLEVMNFGNSQPYPMYFTIKGHDGEHFQEVATNSSGEALIRDKKHVMANYVAGVSDVTAAHTETLEVGDSLTINKVEHLVEQIVESRKPRGKRFVKGAMWYSLKCSYVRFTGKTV